MTSSRLVSLFEQLASRKRKALIPFVTAGFPEPGATVPLMKALVAGGADVIELGIPFSDPMADGPTIQRASEVALSYGTSLRTVLGMVREFRKGDALTPVVLMGYTNPIEAFGPTAFAQEAALAGVDGVLVVDCPPQEARELAGQLRQQGICPIFLLAPTSSDRRIAEAGELGQGYVYYVSLTGVTGAGHLDTTAVAARIPQVKRLSGLPVAVGFGIRDAASAARIAETADGVVIGSRIIEEINHSPRDELMARVTAFVAELREAMDKKE